MVDFPGAGAGVAVGALPGEMVAGRIATVAILAVRGPVGLVVKGRWQPPAGAVAIGTLPSEMVTRRIATVTGNTIRGVHDDMIENRVRPGFRIMAIGT